MNKQQLASKIWESANKMRSKIEANEYKDYILGFIFYKFLSDQEERYLEGEGWDEEYMKIYLREEYDEELFDEDYTEKEHKDVVEGIQKKLGYFISYDNLFSTWLKKESDFNVADVRDALSAFNRLINSTHKNVFDKIFDTLQMGLSKLGENANSQTKAISDLLQLIKDIPMDKKQDYDVLGFIYEYLIQNFAANAGKKAGEFYSPIEVSTLKSLIIAEHLKDRSEIKIYDPTSGSGSLLISIGKAAAKYLGDKNRIKYYAQELKENTYNLTRMNLVMRGVRPDNIVVRNGDTLEDDWPFFEEDDPKGTYEPLYLDAVTANPPYSLSWNNMEKEGDPRYSRFGLAPKSKADYAFLLHSLYHLKPDGIMTIILPHGVLFRGGEEGVIRKNLIEGNHIDTIIGLAGALFFGTSIPTVIIVLRQERKERDDVLIIDASNRYEKVGKTNKLRACDIKKIFDVVTKRESVDKFSRVVSREEIRKNDYNLNIPRYVDSSEDPESWDLYASMFGGIPDEEINSLSKYWDAFPNLKDAVFTKVNDAYSDISSENVKETVLTHPDVISFINKYHAAFDGFDDYLVQELIYGMMDVNINRKESDLSDSLFERLKDIPLIDKYEAYQILYDQWQKIEGDLEIIQTEGPEAIRQVDPNMVLKKKKGKDVEVQEGWSGHVIPFDLAQKILLSKTLSAIKADEQRLSEITAEYEELLESLPEEEKEKDFISEDQSSFVWPMVKKAIKAKEVDPEILDVLKRASSLNEEEKILKGKIKDETIDIQAETKKVIESLSDSDISLLLKEKWVNPILIELKKLPNAMLDQFVKKLEKLKDKYKETLADIDKQIHETEQELVGMLRQLTGNEYDMKGVEEFIKLLGG